MSEKANNVPARSTGYKVFGFVKKLFIYLLAIGIIIAAVLFAADHSPQKSLFGYRYYTVLTPSMSPTYKTGDMVFVKLQNASDINVGDVITFNPSSSSDAYLTHRVTQKLENYDGTGVTCFRTKGDANDAEDAMLIDQSRVIGSVKFSIPKLGYIVRFVQLRWYFVAALIILLWIFFRLLNMYLAPKSEETDNAPQAPETAEKTE
ncbi:signal peptidase I [Ruminococcus sp.]|uniref:signal peptidase I n=1 Tax=Ruminococcus sp. TaxID=41978 RepID=UPI0025DE29F0|nr:signal peptidase I [Ruminococcus sp.]MBQ6251980.1 signal peptidase I [Ruminococcus sp.]MBR6994693.1 signal peptidase I [Ruminococcus sp.]